MVSLAKVETQKVTQMRTKAGRTIEQFLQECKKKSEDTEINYRGDIRRFLDIVYDKTIDTITFEELDCLDFDIFTEYINKDFGKLSNNTINRHTSSIKELMRHLKKRGFVDPETGGVHLADIAYLDLITMMPDDSKRIEHMSKEVVMRYIDEAGRERHNALAKQHIIMLAVDTALRLEDYLALEWSQLSPQEDGVILTGYGKGNKRWIEKISHDVYKSLLELKVNQEMGETKVFAPLSRKNVTDMMTRFKSVLGYQDRRYSFHSFKKTAVTFAYRLTGDILEAMKKGKHSNVKTTMTYVEEVDYGITGMFSLGSHDDDLYKRVSHEELLAALDELNKDTLFLLNLKLKKNMA